jgi:hypothetical protein
LDKEFRSQNNDEVEVVEESLECIQVPEADISAVNLVKEIH